MKDIFHLTIILMALAAMLRLIWSEYGDQVFQAWGTLAILLLCLHNLKLRRRIRQLDPAEADMWGQFIRSSRKLK